jgi:hypothetical protein
MHIFNVCLLLMQLSIEGELERLRGLMRVRMWLRIKEGGGGARMSLGCRLVYQ